MNIDELQKMKLNDFIDELILDIKDFQEDWHAKNRINSYYYPLESTAYDWLDRVIFYLSNES